MKSPRLWLFLLSLALAIALKLTVQEDEQESALSLGPVSVQTTIPSGFLVMNPEDTRVQLQLRGKISDMRDINTATVRLVANIPATAPGIVEVPLGPDNVTLPGDIEVLAIEPNKLVLEIDREITKVLPIVIDTTGEPAAGAQAGEPVVRPRVLTVVGAESLLRNISELRANVSIDRRAISFEERVSPILPQTVRLAQPTPIVVFVPMKEPELSIDGVANDDADAEQR